MKQALIVANTSGLITRFLRNDISILQTMGFEICCACNMKYLDVDDLEYYKIHRISVFQVDFPIRALSVKKMVTASSQLKKILTARQYDLIHCHTTIAAAITRQCAKGQRKRGARLIYTSHGLPFYNGVSHKKYILYSTVENYFSKFTDAMVTICNEDFENASKMKCRHVYHINGVGVDTKRFTTLQFDRDKYREKLGFQKNDIVILSIGELNANKNHQIIVRALAKLNNPNYIYAVCGREVTDRGKAIELQELGKQLGVRIVLLGFRSDIPQVCRSAEIGALPSFKEGLGLSGIEMLASGIPVVGSNRQGIKDYVKGGITGFLCDPSDADTFAEGIRKLSEPGVRKAMRANCIEEAKQYDSQLTCLQIEEIYKNVLNDNSAQRRR